MGVAKVIFKGFFLLKIKDFKMLYTDFLIGIIPEVVGLLVLATAFYFIFFNPSKEKFWGCFIIGSFLMSTPLITGVLAKPELMPTFGASFFISAVTWIVFMITFSVATSSKDNYVTNDDFLTIDENAIELSNTNNKEIYLAVWDEYNSNSSKFKFRILKLRAVDTYLNKLLKKQHYVKCFIEHNFDNVSECESYLQEYLEAPHRINIL